MTEATVAAPAGMPALFEINLLADRIHRLRRQQHFEQTCAAVALALVLVSAVLGVISFKHLLDYRRFSLGLKQDQQDLDAQKKLFEEMDTLKRAAADELKAVAPLLPIARARVAWTPKLVALAEALPPEFGILQMNANSGEVFMPPPPPAPAPVTDASGKAAPPAPPARTAEPPRMDFSIVYHTGGQSRAMTLLTRLRESPNFTRQMGEIRLDSMDTDTWQGASVTVLRGSCKGRPRTP